MSQGWVSIHRQIKQHWLWTTDKPFDKRSAWIDLVLSANHTGNKFVLGNQLVTVQKGEFITSELKLMERWGWGKTKLRNFLKLLEDDGMITKKSTNKQTTITIVNYCLYQEPQTIDDTSDKPQTNNKQTADVQQTYTNNNEVIMSNKERTNDNDNDNDNDNEESYPDSYHDSLPKAESPAIKPTSKGKKKVQEPKVQYSEYVTMTPKERQKIVESVGEEGTLRCIEILNNYKGATGKTYKSDYFVMLNWVIDRYNKEARNGTSGKHSTEAKKTSKWGNLEGIIHL